MNITIKQLSVFVSIVRNGNLTRAAQALFMTKGAISQALSELESQLGVRLFERQHARLVINHEGYKLLPVADELLIRMRGIEQLFSENGQHSPITVGCTKSIGCYLLPDILNMVESRTGKLPQTIIANTSVISSMLNRFELDVALLEAPATESNIVTTPWIDDEMIVIAAKNHPLANAGTISYGRLNQERWILRELGSGSRTFFDNYLSLELGKVDVGLSINNFEGILSCVQRNLGITFMSSHVLNQPYYIDYFSQIHIEKKYFRKLTICYNKNKFLSPALIEWITLCHAWGRSCSEPARR